MQIEFKDLLTLSVSCGALVFSFLNYRRSRKMENENHVFKLKIELYSKIISQANSLLNELNSIAKQGREEVITQKDLSKSRLKELAKKADQISFEFDDFVIVNCLIVPDKVLIRMNQLAKKLLKDATLYGEYSEHSSPLDKIDEFIDGLYLEIAELADLFRQDLHINKLNSSLFKRLR